MKTIERITVIESNAFIEWSPLRDINLSQISYNESSLLAGVVQESLCLPIYYFIHVYLFWIPIRVIRSLCLKNTVGTH